MRKQVKLNRGSVTVPYPPGFTGQKSGDPMDEEFIVSSYPRFLTVEEIKLAEVALRPTKLVYTDCVLLDSDDPLLTMTAEELDQLEEKLGLENSAMSPGGGQRAILERVLSIRHAGYEEGGRLAIAGS